MESWLINGVHTDTVTITDRGLTYGDGVFETIAIRDGQPRFLERHLHRLARGCDRLGIPGPSPELLNEELRSLIQSSPRQTAKIIVTRGPGPRGYALPREPAPTRAIGVGLAPAMRIENYRDGVRVQRCRIVLGENSELAGIKHLNRLEQVLARREWTDEGIAEGLMFSSSGWLVCGTMSNLFLVRQRQLLTPKLDLCGVAGIMRGLVLEAAAEEGIACSETRLRWQDFIEAEEVFISNSQFGIWPVTGCEAQHFSCGPVTRRLIANLAARGVEECAG